MTDAEQVACDALRSAGLDELADNLEWAKAALHHRDAVHAALLAVDNEFGHCDGRHSYTAKPCDGDNRTVTHDRLCPKGAALRAMSLATDGQWAAMELETAHAEAHERMRATPSLLGEWAQRQPGTLFGVDPRLSALSDWGLNDVVTGAMPRTVAGRLDQAAELVRLGTVTPEDYLRVVGVDDGASPSVDAYWAGTLRDLKK